MAQEERRQKYCETLRMNSQKMSIRVRFFITKQENSGSGEGGAENRERMDRA